MPYRIGIDAGSKTIKVVILDESGSTMHTVYRRHRANIRMTLEEVLHDLIWRFGDMEGHVAITGSAGIGLADMLGLPFVQEVMATTHAVQEAYPEADVIIELGGEDAKIVYLTDGLEQRMNATCAGGTGGFIDTIAFMLGVRPQDMNGLALGASHLYPIASRCAVFAQTDVRPLLNAGARKTDIAASVLEAVVRQTLGGLACGRPIRGTVVFLGGPLEHIPDLVYRFRSALKLTHRTGIKPQDAHLVTARGAALSATDGTPRPTSWECRGDTIQTDGSAPIVALSELEERLAICPNPVDDLDRLPPLFQNEKEREVFRTRHAHERIPRTRLFDCEGPVYLGIDSGSTTVKLVVVNEAGSLVYSDYRPVEGDALKTASSMLVELYRVLPKPYRQAEPTVHIAHATATGYGEDLLRAGLGIDSGAVETTAHLHAALALRPDTTFVLDIGGQDMKALWVRDGLIVDAMLNEACSSGCGAFIEGTAHALHATPQRFAEAALKAPSPLDLGTKCTVFMTSRVRHAQKIGMSLPDIAAGVAYSVVQNALYRIIGRNKIASMGNVVIAQGGAFKSDAVLRAFEFVAGVKVIRPDAAHLMGAIGAALIARKRAQTVDADDARHPDNRHSTLIDAARLTALDPKRTEKRCPGCTNACALSIVTFEEGRHFISGNRCDRALAYVADAPGRPDTSQSNGDRAVDRTMERHRMPPNIAALERNLLERYDDRTGDARRGDVSVGIMGTLSTYEQLPFWHALLSSLGFSVLVPNDERIRSQGSEGIETIPSESVCQPAKLNHTRLYDLARAGASVVLMPRYVRGIRCPVACGYADALRNNVPLVSDGTITFVTPLIHAIHPAKLATHDDDRAALRTSLASFAPAQAPLAADEFDGALAVALDAQRTFEREIIQATEQALAWVHSDEGRHGILLAGRPYHHDPALLHGIDGILERLGFAVLMPLGFTECMARKNRTDRSNNERAGMDTWKPARRLVELVRIVIADPTIDLVCLQSFGCGYDAVNLERAREMLAEARRPFTVLKIDDIADTAHVGIRLRTLAETIDARELEKEDDLTPSFVSTSINVNTSTKQSCYADQEQEISYSKPLLGTIEHDDLDTTRSDVPSDLCYTVAALAAHAIRLVRTEPSIESLAVPAVCERCLLEALPDLIERACGHAPTIIWEHTWNPEHRLKDNEKVAPASTPNETLSHNPRIGIVGNALLCFDPFMNDNLVHFLETLDCEPVLPDPVNLFTDDVRYLTQLDTFADTGVDHVIYLQSFGCLKGHIQSRGARCELAWRYPNMPVTVIDYDPESSALNRENRIRLAVEAAHQART